MGLNERQEELVSTYLDGELAGEEQLEAEALLASEPEAARLLEHYRADHARLRGLPRVKAEPRHRARLQPPRRTVAPHWLRVAAVVLIVLGLALWFQNRGPMRKLITLAAGAESRVAPGERLLVKQFEGLSGRLVAAATTAFRVRVEGADGHSSEAHLLLSYDFEGDGKFDRVETYQLVADAAAGWEDFTHDTARLIKTDGDAMRDFADGAVKAELHCVHPENALLADVQEITLPAETP